MWFREIIYAIEDFVGSIIGPYEDELMVLCGLALLIGIALTEGGGAMICRSCTGKRKLNKHGYCQPCWNVPKLTIIKDGEVIEEVYET